jgi:hypothetical protein
VPRGKRKAADPTADKLAPRMCHWRLCGRRFTPDTTSRYHCSDGCAAACLKERMGGGSGV